MIDHPGHAAALPPPGPMEGPGAPDDALPEDLGRAGGSDAPDRKAAESLYAQRLWIGYTLGASGLITLGVGLWWSLSRLHELAAPTGWVEEKFLFVKLGVHGAITIAFVWFIYQVLRLAERLVLPYWWVAKEASPARTMLGIRDPAAASVKLLAEATKLLASWKSGSRGE